MVNKDSLIIIEQIRKESDELIKVCDFIEKSNVEELDVLMGVMSNRINAYTETFEGSNDKFNNIIHLLDSLSNNRLLRKDVNYEEMQNKYLNKVL